MIFSMFHYPIFQNVMPCFDFRQTSCDMWPMVLYSYSYSGFARFYLVGWLVGFGFNGPLKQ